MGRREIKGGRGWGEKKTGMINECHQSAIDEGLESHLGLTT